jgi:hypothetical protein
MEAKKKWHYSPNLDNLSDVLLQVRFCAHDQNSVEEVDWQTVRTTEFCSSYSGHTSVRGHNNQR